MKFSICYGNGAILLRFGERSGQENTASLDFYAVPCQSENLLQSHAGMVTGEQYRLEPTRSPVIEPRPFVRL